MDGGKIWRNLGRNTGIKGIAIICSCIQGKGKNWAMFEDMREPLDYAADDWAHDFNGLKWDEWARMLPDEVWFWRGAIRL
jgi:hypothetical protein